jgi:hypothetical protein
MTQKGANMKTDTYARKWQITVNNPNDKGFTHEYIKEVMTSFKKLVYWCMADEVGECGTYHTHIYMVCSSVVRFSSIKKRFQGGHFEMCRGTSQENRDYIFKLGKHEKGKKAETHLPETREEYGEIPVERPGQRNDLADVQDMVETGMSNTEIIKMTPQYSFNIDKIEKMRQTFLWEKHKKEKREVEVIYVYGDTGTGKTHDIMEEHGYENVYTVTDYDHPFDGYEGQSVMLFEEFTSSLRINAMLKHLDVYPHQLPCRYSNRVAMYTKVYFATNIKLEDQYKHVQKEHPKTWYAFIRRINKVKEYSSTKMRIFERTVKEELWWDVNVQEMEVLQ